MLYSVQRGLLHIISKNTEIHFNPFKYDVHQHVSSQTYMKTPSLATLPTMLAYWHILKLHPCNLSFGTMKIEVPGHPLCVLSLELPGICLLEGEKTVMVLGYPHGCTARGL